MYDYISGSIVELTPTKMIVDNQGIGYEILISLQSYSKFQKLKEGKAFIHHLFKEKEGEELLYGFFDRDEREIFQLLITVSGIGPNTARMMLSSLSTDEVRNALISGDVNKIKSVKGIGLKTAQKAIIELKDKIIKGGSSASDGIPLGRMVSTARNEALSALVLLGFSKVNVEKVIDSILEKEPSSSLEELIKKGLKLL